MTDLGATDSAILATYRYVSTCCRGIHELYEWKSIDSSSMVLDSNIRFSVNKKRMNVHVVWFE